ncbi:MAG TPA: efflux RND transporter periplasmic adaptor subunit [Cytophagaceae bacterium]
MKMKSPGIILIYCTILVLLFSCSQENKHEHSHHHSHSDEPVTYYCPMCPGQEQDSPGVCKVCKMDLVKREDKFFGVTKDMIVMPVNEYVQGELPVVKPIDTSFAAKLKVSGFITYDPQRVNNVSSRFEGRIEKLYKRYEYQPVKKGEPLFDVFSHSLIAAQQEYVFLKKNETDEYLLKKARKKLELLGLTSLQIDKLNHHDHKSSVTVYSPYTGFLIRMDDPAFNMSNVSSMNSMNASLVDDNSNGLRKELLKEGAFISKATPVMKIANTDIVWGILNIYAKDITSVNQGDPVALVIQGSSDTISAKISYIESVLNEQYQTIRARVILPNAGGAIKINSLLNAEISTRPVKGLWLPEKAVYDLGNKFIVFKKEGSHFKSLEVEIGIITNGFIQVLTGISANDEIASAASYLTDSESSIKVE